MLPAVNHGHDINPLLLVGDQIMPRKRNPPESDQIQTYLFEIKEIIPDYSFGVAHSRFDQGAFGEYAHTEITAICVVPQKLSGRETRFLLIGDRRITQELNKPGSETPWNGIGTLTMRGTRSEYLGSFPLDVLIGLAPLIQAEWLRFITLSGPQLRHGSSRISHFRFVKHADPDDY